MSSSACAHACAQMPPHLFTIDRVRLSLMHDVPAWPCMSCTDLLFPQVLLPGLLAWGCSKKCFEKLKQAVVCTSAKVIAKFQQATYSNAAPKADKIAIAPR